MKTKTITTLSIAAIFLILIAQIIVIYSYYNSSKFALKKEVNSILDESFQKDLDRRRFIADKQNHASDTINLPSKNKDKEVGRYNLDKMNIDKSEYMSIIRTVINEHISKTCPIDIKPITTIITASLNSRSIYSQFKIEIIELNSSDTNKLIHKFTNQSSFGIESDPLFLNLKKDKALRLTLINPFATLFKTMGGLLVTSLFLSLFCFFGLWFLFRTLAKQKELTTLKDDFFGHIAHEIKRPVNHLVMAIDALSKNSTDTNPAFKSQCLSISKNAIDEISEKMKMIMALSMAEEGVFQLHYSEFDINQVIQGLIDKFSLFSNKKVMFSVVAPPSPMMVKGDKEHLSQCFANLIDNAIKYSNERVSIEIKLEIVDSEILLSVRDNGIGIAPQKLNKIFEKYSRLHRDKQSITGYGIGLNYVKTIVEKHTGRISVASEEQKGSEFRLWIPA